MTLCDLRTESLCKKITEYWANVVSSCDILSQVSLVPDILLATKICESVATKICESDITVSIYFGLEGRH